jgi:type IV secretion system protein VirD4
MPDNSPQPADRLRQTLSQRSPRERFLIALWGLFIAFTAWGTVSNGITLGQSPTSSPYSFSPAAPLAGSFALDLWGLWAALYFGFVVVPNRFHWGNGKRWALGSLVFAMMLGRVSGGGLVGWGLDYLGAPPLVAMLVAPLALLAGGALLITIIGVTIFGLFAFFVGIPAAVFTQILRFENALHVYRYQTDGLTGRIVRFMMWLRNETPPAPLPDDSRGARFSTFEETKSLASTDRAAMAFGHIGRPVLLKTEKHVLIMASTRSGKGVTLIIPHLLRYPGSAFILDPKSENARATGRQRSHLNDQVHYLDPFGISGKPQSRFNPLARFTPENMEAESKALAAALFIIGDGQRDHWTAAGQQLVASIILFVYVSDKVAKEEKDLPMMRHILLGGVKQALKAMLEIDVADGLLRDLAMSFLETPEKEFGSIISTAQRQTEILDNPYIIKCLSASGVEPEVDFKAWHTGTMSVFLCLSAPKFPVFNRWLRLVLTSALDEMTDTLNPPALPVCFMLDELATLGHLATVENAVGLAAGYGIQLITVFQDIAQMRGLYKGRWASFIGNAGIRALFNLDDYDTAEYWSKFMGGQLVETYSRQEDIYGLSKGQNVGESMRPLIAPEKIMMQFAGGAADGSDQMLVLAQGAHPIVTIRRPYWQDKTLNGLWDDPRVLSPATPRPVPPQTPPAPAATKPTPRQAAPAAAKPEPPKQPAPAAPLPTAAPPNGAAQPTLVATRSDESSRNAPCHCGSGKKYKHCHGVA